jgi:hypothetical protein
MLWQLLMIITLPCLWDDWLAFAHLILAVVFVALIAGYVRGISFYWRLLDCSFGVIGAVPLILCLRYVAQLEKMDA